MSLTEEQKLNREEMSPNWFSEPQKTKEAAEALHQPSVLEFDPAAVYRRESEGDYVMGRLNRTAKCPPHKEANFMNERLGFVMVSYFEPIFIWIWIEYQLEPVAAK